MSSSKKILVYRLSSLGDIILTYNFLFQLRKNNPDAEIFFITKIQYADAVKSTGLVNETICIDNVQEIRKYISESSFDLIYDLHKTPRSKKLFAGMNNVITYDKETLSRILLVLFKYRFSKNYTPVFLKYIKTLKNFEEDFKCILADKINTKSEEEYIVVSPSSRHFTKRYPLQNYIQILNSLKLKVHITGDDSDTDKKICTELANSISGSVNHSGKLSFYDLACLISNSKLVLCNDSAILHLAESLNKKVFVFFGSTVKEFGFYPSLRTTEVFEINNLKCRPCTKIGRKSCPLDNLMCLNDIKPEDVINKINKYLNENIS